MKIIKEMKFEVSGGCQNDCFSCAHADMLATYRGYQLTLQELKYFIECTKKSDYFINELAVHGIGEPLLWEHFNEGIRILKESGIIGRLIVTTNGILMRTIKEETWKYIDKIILSLYANYKDSEYLDELKSKYKDKIHIEYRDYFRPKLLKGYKNKTPGCCWTFGPMFIKDKMFIHCGPPVFDAAKLKGVNIFDQRDLYTEMKPNYMDAYDEKKIGNMDICNYCWANISIHLPEYPWGYVPSDSALKMHSWLTDTVISIIPKSIRNSFNGMNSKLKGMPKKIISKILK